MGKSMTFIGPRAKTLAGFKTEKYTEFMHQLKEQVRTFITNGYDRFYVSAAQGFDQLAFWAVYHMKKEFPHIKTALILPYTQFAYSWADKGLFSREHLAQIKDLADIVYFTSEATPVGVNALTKTLDAMNERMIRNTDALCVLTCDDPAGTKHAVRHAMDYARLNEKTIYEMVCGLDVKGNLQLKPDNTDCQPATM